MPAVDLIDETFVAAPPDVVAAAVHDPDRWTRWWPDLRLAVFRDRGPKGMIWTVTGALVGSAEVWVEPWGDGVVVHLYLRVDPPRRGSATEPQPEPGAGDMGGWRRAARLRARRATAWKRSIWELKDELEQGRPAGVPRDADTVWGAPR